MYGRGHRKSSGTGDAAHRSDIGIAPIAAAVKSRFFAHVTGGPGTLGLFVQSGKTPGFLSCSHVQANGGDARAGDAIHHPAEADDRLHHPRIGSLRRFVGLRGDGPYTMDAAFAELAGSVEVDGNKIPRGQGWPSEGRAARLDGLSDNVHRISTGMAEAKPIGGMPAGDGFRKGLNPSCDFLPRSMFNDTAGHRPPVLR
jgi:hypothetical protein